MATLTNFVRWADNTPELRRNLAQGLDQIEAVRAGAERMVQSLGGEKLIRAAHNAAAAVQQLGGATKLTANEQERIHGLVSRAIEKYQALGKEAPSALRQLAEATKAQEPPTQSWLSRLTDVQNLFRGLLAFGIVRWFQDLVAGALASASAMDKMRATTDIGFQGLQRLENIAVGSNTTVQALTSSILDMQRKLVTGDESAIGAVEGLVGSLTDFNKLKGDEQFMKIARAIGAMTNAKDQDEASFRIYGRSYKEISSAIKSDVDALAASVATNSDAQIAKIADLETRWQQFWLSVDRGKLKTFDLATQVADLTQAVFGQTDAVYGLATAYGVLDKAQIVTDKVPVPGAPTMFSNTLPRVAPMMGDAALTTTYRDLNTVLQERERLLKKGIETAEKVAASMATVEVALDQELSAIFKINPLIADLVVAGDKAGVSQADLARAFSLTEAEVNKLIGIHTTYDEILKINGATAIATAADLTKIGLSVGAQELAWVRMKIALREIDRPAMEAVAGISQLQQELTSVGTTLEVDVVREMEAFWRSTGKGVAEVARLSAELRVAMNGARDLGDTLKSLFTGDFRAVFTDLKAGVLGGLNDIFQSAFEGGGGVGGAIKSFATSAVAMVSNMIPVIGPIVSQFAGAIVAGFKKIGSLLGFGDSESDKARKLRQELIKTAGGIDTVREAAIRAGFELGRLLNARKVKDVEAAWRDLQAAIDFQDQAMQTLEETLARYTFTIEEKGPAIALREQSQLAAQLYQDFRVLTAAGVDHVAIAREMAASTNLYVQNALKMGQEIPEFMRTQIAQMIALGLLYDQNGNKIESLEGSGITFAQTMTQNVRDIIRAVQDLIEAIDRGLGNAIRLVPPIVVDVQYNDPGFTPNHPSFPQPLPPPRGTPFPPRLHAGGVIGAAFDHVLPFIPRAHQGLAIGDVPIIGQTGEGIVSRQGMAGIGAEGLAAINRGGGASRSVVVNVDARGSLFDDTSADKLADKILNRIHAGGPRRSKFNSLVRKAG